MSANASLSFFDHFESLDDPRVQRSKLHPLPNIVFIAVCAVLCGSNDFVGMAKFGVSKLAWLGKYLDLANGVPSHDTFGRVLSVLDPVQFVACFTSWVKRFADSAVGRLIGIDGKTARASLNQAAGRNPLHVVSAWASDVRLVLGQVAVDEKSNEITAIPKLLELLELSGAVVTLDAMGCQKEIADKIREGGGDYVLAVKGNQEHLADDVIAHFAALDEAAEQGRLDQQATVYETTDADHGREEHRRCQAVPAPKALRGHGDWKDLKSICRVTRTYVERGQEKSEVRYFISSLKSDARMLGRAVRGHWGVENGLHWVLDMTFAEDRSRARTGHAQHNFALLRRWVLSLLRQDETITASIEKKRLMAGWNGEILERFLKLF